MLWKALFRVPAYFAKIPENRGNAGNEIPGNFCRGIIFPELFFPAVVTKR
jgi:hypothetical protein